MTEHSNDTGNPSGSLASQCTSTSLIERRPAAEDTLAAEPPCQRMVAHAQSLRAVGPQRERSGQYKLADGQGLSLVVLGEGGLEVTTNEFKRTRDGKVRVRVTAEPSPPPPAADPERRAAEWVLSVGGSLMIEGIQVAEIQAPDQLPRGPFKVRSIHLGRAAEKVWVMRRDVQRAVSDESLPWRARVQSMKDGTGRAQVAKAPRARELRIVDHHRPLASPRARSRNRILGGKRPSAMSS